MLVFAVNGISLSGKDSFCERVYREYNCRQPIKKTNIRSPICDKPLVQIISTINPIKKLYQSFFNWDGEKSDIHRQNLNTLKQVWITACDGPTSYLRKLMSIGQMNSVPIMFVMVREFDEMVKVVELGDELCGNAATIKLVREGIPIPPVEQAFLDSHPKDYVYDWTIINPTVKTFPDIPKLDVAASKFLDLVIAEDGYVPFKRVWNPVDELFTNWII